MKYDNQVSGYFYSVYNFPKIRLHLLFFIFLILANVCLISSLYAVPDLTINGFIKPEDGLGKLPIVITETLGDRISTNIHLTNVLHSYEGLPPVVQAALANPDTKFGKVLLYTEALWYKDRIPSEQMPQKGLIKIAYSMFETTRIPAMWVKILNKKFDAVVVPDEFHVRVYEDCGVKIPIFVLPIPMMLSTYFAHPPHSKNPSTPFTFGDASANKNPAVLVEGFAKAFGNNPDVQLIMRACTIRQDTRQIVNDLKAFYGLTNVILEEGPITLNEYIDRLMSFDCYVNVSRGEGFSFIPREALGLGLPVIITNNTASTTICNSGFVRAVASTKKVPPLPVYQQLFNEDCGEQFDCEAEDVAAALLDVYHHYEEYVEKAHEGRKWVEQYNCTNPKLRNLYRTLVKPKRVVLGKKNAIKNGVLITNSMKLQMKYQQIILSNQ